MCGGLQISRNEEDETETLKRRSRNGRRAKRGFVCVYPPPVSCNCVLRSRGLYFPQGIRVLCGEYSSTCRRVRCRTPQGVPVLRARQDAPARLHGGASRDATESASGLLLGINKSSQSASWRKPGGTSPRPPPPRVPENSPPNAPVHFLPSAPSAHRPPSFWGKIRIARKKAQGKAWKIRHFCVKMQLTLKKYTFVSRVFKLFPTYLQKTNHLLRHGTTNTENRRNYHQVS